MISRTLYNQAIKNNAIGFSDKEIADFNSSPPLQLARKQHKEGNDTSDLYTEAYTVETADHSDNVNWYDMITGKFD